MDISDYLPMFLADGRERLQELNLSVVRVEAQPDDPETVDEIFRIAHSLKAMSATMGFAGMAALTHEMEDVFELLRQRMDGLGCDAVTVLLRSLDTLSEAVDAIEADGTERIVRVDAERQDQLIPVEAVFLRFPRLLRDLSTELGKQVDLQLVGKETELDRAVVDALGAPLAHLVRNALDHGLESPATRVAAGKRATGTLEISARRAGALSSMLGRSVDISVPTAAALPVAEAVEAVGPAERLVTGVVIGVEGDMTATVLLLLGEPDAATLCDMLGVNPADEMAASALGEIGNIVGASYIDALGAMTGLNMAPEPPRSATDMLAAIVASVLAGRAGGDETALVLDSDLTVEGEDCSISFLLVPSSCGVNELLTRLGLGD